MKKCTKCKKEKKSSEYLTNRKGTKYEYTLNYCNSCRKKQVYKSTNRSIGVFLRDKHFRSKLRANKLSIKYNLNPEFLLELWERQNGKCFYTDIKLVWGVGKGLSINSISIDKINPELGYITENVVLCSCRINTIKHNMTLKEMKKWTPDWYKRIINHYKKYS